jgi:hypothetical protein
MVFVMFQLSRGVAQDWDHSTVTSVETQYNKLYAPHVPKTVPIMHKVSLQ